MTGLSFLMCHAASISISLFTRAVILSRIDPSNETFDYPTVDSLISFPLKRERTVGRREEVQQRELKSSTRLRMGGSSSVAS